MSCTPGCSSCINSNSLLTTVLRNFQCARRNRGYCPTTYIMLEATTALLSFPRFISPRPKKPRVLPNHVHNVGGDHRFVVLPALHLAQPEQVLNYSHQEALLILLRHGTRDGAYRPAQRVQVVPRPLRAVHLVLQLFEHNVLSVVVVEVG